MTEERPINEAGPDGGEMITDEESGGAKAAFPAPIRSHSSLKTRMIAGVVTLIPIIVTILVVMFISDQLLTIFRPVTDMFWQNFTPTIEKLFPDKFSAAERIAEARRIKEAFSIFFSLVLAVLTIYMVGLFSSNIIVRRFLGLGERMLERIPVIKTVYGTMKQMAEAFSMRNNQEMQKTVIVEYPRKGILSMGFVTGETTIKNDKQIYVNIFIPTTPNPTSGFILIVPAEEVRETALTIEEAFKFIISGGLLEMRNLELKPYHSSHLHLAKGAEPKKAGGAIKQNLTLP